MKQLTHNLLKVRFEGVDFEDIERIEFVFSQYMGKSPSKVESYPSDTAFLIEGSTDTVGVVWTAADTELFPSDRNFYMDTRITLKSTPFQPATQIVKARMDATLFEEWSS